MGLDIGGFVLFLTLFEIFISYAFSTVCMEEIENNNTMIKKATNTIDEQGKMIKDQSALMKQHETKISKLEQSDEGSSINI